jgi:hypothetical protein
MTWNFRRIIGLISVVGGIALVFTLIFFPVPERNAKEIWLAIGLILGWGGTVVTYEFGSSSGGRALALGEKAREELE